MADIRALTTVAIAWAVSPGMRTCSSCTTTPAPETGTGILLGTVTAPGGSAGEEKAA